MTSSSSGPRTERGLRPRRRVALAALSGLLLFAAFPPLDLGWFAPLALVPLFIAWHDARPAAGALAGAAFGLVFFGTLCSWAWRVGFVAYIPLVVVMAAWSTLTGAAVTWLGARRVTSPWIAAALWIALEALRGRWPLGGFSWGEAGYALHDLAPARSLAAWGGVPLVSLAVVATAALLARLLSTRERRARARAVMGLAAIVIGTTILYVERPRLAPDGQLRAALVQGNDKNRDLTVDELAERYLPVSHLRLATTIDRPVDLIVFPESSLDADPREDESLAAQLQATARAHFAALLVNAVTDAPRGRLYNMNLLYAPDGRLVGTYAKQHLVPFGEYVPLRRRLRFIHELDQVPSDFTPGKHHRAFPIAGHRVGTVICFESAFADLIRGDVRRGASAIVVSTNNRSFQRTSNAAQHVAMSQLRAAETGRPVLQAAISGISAVIDGNGRVAGRTRLFRRTVLYGDVTLTRGRTPYVAWGEWAAALGMLVSLAGVAAALRTRGRVRPPASVSVD